LKAEGGAVATGGAGSVAVIEDVGGPSTTGTKGGGRR
jgi:hypothetical protein